MIAITDHQSAAVLVPHGGMRPDVGIHLDLQRLGHCSLPFDKAIRAKAETSSTKLRLSHINCRHAMIKAS